MVVTQLVFSLHSTAVCTFSEVSIKLHNIFMSHIEHFLPRHTVCSDTQFIFAFSYYLQLKQILYAMAFLA